jgi:flagellar biosynthesis GTPase FlhF
MIETPDVPQEIAADIATVTQYAESFAIATDADAQAAANVLAQWKAKENEVIGFFSPIKKNLDAAKRAVLDREKSVLEPLREASLALKAKLGAWHEAQRQAAEEERRRRQAELDRQAEEARQKAREQAAQAQAAAEEAERKRAALEAKAAAARSAKAREKLEAQAKAEEAKAEEARQKARMAQWAEATTFAIDAPAAQAKISGIQTRTVWKFRIVDERAIPRQYLKINEEAIAGVVRSLKQHHGIPGIEAYATEVVAIRSK